ncbi:MAG: alpha/beta hydrolase [Pirellulaceae bacterium]
MNTAQQAGLLVFVTFFALSTQLLAANYKPDREVVYKTVGDVELKLHVFEPQGHQDSDHAPAIVFFFGGGWNGGSPTQFYEQARFMADHGFLAMSAQYRVKSTHKTSPFQCVADGKSAIRYVRKHAPELGVDPDRIVAAGGSAGGHVAACTGVIEGHEQAGEDLAISSCPNAMILFNPVIDTTEKGYGLKSVGEDRKTEISPCHHVRPGIVPTLVFHGTGDTTVPFENAKRFTRLMNEAGNNCQLESFEGLGHGFFNGEFFRPKTTDTSPYKRTMQQSIEFLKSLGFQVLESPLQSTGRQ